MEGGGRKGEEEERGELEDCVRPFADGRYSGFSKVGDCAYVDRFRVLKGTGCKVE